MKYLLDSHIIMWVLLDDKRISKQLKTSLLDSNNQVYYSTVSVWEVEIKHQKIESFKLSGDQLAFLCDQNDMINLPIKNKHVSKLKDILMDNVNIDHKDPFDKMLLAQSLDEDMVFITHDHKFKGYTFRNIMLI